MTEINMKQLALVVAEHGLLALYMFGSVAAGTAAPDSDIDLAALWPQGDLRWQDVETYIDLYDQLAGCVIGRRLDLILMQQVSLELQYQVLASDKVLYCSDHDMRTDYEDLVLRDYLDFAVEMRLYDSEVAEAIREKTVHG